MKRIVFTFMMLAAVLVINAQDFTANDAKQAFNDGAKAYNEQNYKVAIDAFNSALEMCEQVGEGVEEVQANAEGQLPLAYIGLAKQIYKDDIDGAIEACEKAVIVAERTNNPSAAEKANELVSKLYNGKGKLAYKNENYEEALNYFIKATEADPQYAEAYFLQGVIYKINDNEEKLKETMLKGKEIAENTKDMGTLDKIVTTSKNYFYNKAIKEQKANQFETAVAYLESALEFDDKFENAYYLLALVYNELASVKNDMSMYDKSIEAAQKALDNNNSTATDKAKIYFEMGRAHQGRNDVANACKAYSNAMFGAYLKSAEYQRKQILKCTD